MFTLWLFKLKVYSIRKFKTDSDILFLNYSYIIIEYGNSLLSHQLFYYVALLFISYEILLCFVVSKFSETNSHYFALTV